MKKFFASIRFKIIFPIVMLILIFLVLSNGNRIYSNYNDLNVEFYEKLTSHLEVAKLSLAQPMWVYNEKSITSIGEALLSNKEVGSILITDHEGAEMNEKGSNFIKLLEKFFTGGENSHLINE